MKVKNIYKEHSLPLSDFIALTKEGYFRDPTVNTVIELTELFKRYEKLARYIVIWKRMI